MRRVWSNSRVGWVTAAVFAALLVAAIGVVVWALWPAARPLPPPMENPDAVTYRSVGWLQFWGAFLGALTGAALTAAAVFVTGTRAAEAQVRSAEITAAIQERVAHIQAQGQRDLALDQERRAYRTQEVTNFCRYMNRPVRTYQDLAMALAENKVDDAQRLLLKLRQDVVAPLDADVSGVRDWMFKTAATTAARADLKATNQIELFARSGWEGAPFGPLVLQQAEPVVQAVDVLNAAKVAYIFGDPILRAQVEQKPRDAPAVVGNG